MRKKIIIALIIAALIVTAVIAFPALADGKTSEKLVIGDVNGDGRINISDCVMISLYCSKAVDLSKDQLKRANVNGDSAVNENDAKYLAGFIAKNIDKFEDDFVTPIIPIN